MKIDFRCKYSILDCDVICEHKFARVEESSIETLHNHDGYEIVLFLGGDVTLFVESDEKKMERGDLIFIRSYAFHGLKLKDIASYERVVINIRESFLHKLSDENTDLSMCFHRMPSKRLNVIHLNEIEIRRFVSLANDLEQTIRNQHYGYTILSKAILSELMVLANQYAETYHRPLYSNIMPSIITKTYEYIDKNLTTNITVESLAKKLHYNSDYLNRAFKNATGSSLKYYITAKKITLAQQFLRQGFSPYDVCFMVGYTNYSSFSRRFSEQVGMPPKQFQISSQVVQPN